MRIGVLGAGPSGLYFALLAKKANPGHEVFVVERNPPDATFGWGVVFSEETLGALRDADRESYLAVTDEWARWSAIDVHHGGEVIRSRGHVFSGIARKRLLEILQERCRSLGVELSFHEELADLSRFDGCDLVVAADGVNSLARKLLADHVKPTLDVHRSKFIWFGTHRVFDAFTFIFRETEHGMFQVHAYPFDGRTSTFIVECSQAVWERAGLERATEEESIAFCSKLFGPELEGHGLLSNRSLWISFVTVRCETWHHGNVVLLGDAAHTAHFTIGSGTKLAMEDSIALHEALLVHPRDLEAALTAHELERQPVVERFQEAARESATYFETVGRYAHFEPLQFSFHLLTRSGRITHLELERRDPAYLARVDRWFDRRDRLVPAPPLLVPFEDLGIANRIALACPSEDAASDGSVGAATARDLRRLAQLEPGIVFTEFTAVSADGRITPGTPGLYVDEHVNAWGAALEDARRGTQVSFGLLLGHAGRRGATRPRGGGLDRPLREGAWPLVAPSPIPYTGRSQVPREMDADDMARVVEAFESAAHRGAEAGFGAILLDFSHGYLLGSFISPLTNHRGDGYGGALENRLRLPVRVLDAVQSAVTSSRPLVGVRYSATDWAKGGLSRSDSLQVAAALRDHGAHFIDVVAGQTVPEQRPTYGRFYLVPYSDVVRNELRVPTVTSGNITTADEANTILAAGRADLVVLDPRRLLP